MCGRTTLSLPPGELQEALGLDEVPVLPPRFNIAPSQPIAVIRKQRHLELLTWGLAMPPGVARGGARGINARGETVARAPLYRDAFARRRCLVIVDGFFEWKHAGQKSKQPYLIRRADGAPFALAGIWESSANADGVIVDACAIITTEAAGVVAELHDRMPVIVDRSEFSRWLEGPRDDAQQLLLPHAENLISYPVSAVVNSPANDDARCLERITPPPPPPENLKLF